MKIHIILHKPWTDSLIVGLVSKIQMTSLNLHRAHKYGILTGIVPDDTSLEEIQKLPEVESLYLDTLSTTMEGLMNFLESISYD